MPELPEVETVKRGLEKLIVGKKILAVNFDWPKSFPNSNYDVENFMIGASISRVERRGKAILIRLSTNYTLAIHLKMTGQLVFVGANSRFDAGHPNYSLISNLPDKSTRVTINFDDSSKLFFNDQRKFGWIRLLPNQHLNELSFFKKMGPEPLDESFSEEEFILRLKLRPRSNIKAVLLDQTIVAGVGNIYADESLWAAGIHPASLVGNISDFRLVSLYKALIEVLILSIEKGGSTDRNYVNAEGKKGSYIQFASVFRREGQPCKRCGHQIKKTRVAGRGTHTCANCQVVY